MSSIYRLSLILKNMADIDKELAISFHGFAEFVKRQLHLMDSTGPQGSPGDVDDDDITGPAMATGQAEVEMDDWSATVPTQLEVGDRKSTSGTSRLLFLTVEYVEEPVTEYGRSSFSTFETGAPFSPQPSTSLSEFEHRVSPLDPNMSSAARYSPVYSMNGGSSTHPLAREVPSEVVSNSSNPSSPFQSQVVVLANSPSPIISSSTTNVLPASPSPNSFIDTTQDIPPGAVVTSAGITHSLVNQILSSQVVLSSDSSGGLLRQVVTGGAYFHQQASTTSANIMTGALGSSPLHPDSPHSPLQPPLTPADSYVVSSSTEALDSVPATPSDFQGDVAISVTDSPSIVDSASDLLIHPSPLHTESQMVDSSGAGQFEDLESGGVVLPSPHGVDMKTEAMNRVHLLISSSDGGSITYSLGGQNGFIGATEEEQLNTVLSTFKSHGIVIEEGESGELHLRQPAERKIGNGVSMNDITLTVCAQPSDLLDQGLLGPPLSGDITEPVTRLGHSLISDDVTISVVDSSLGAATDRYADMLMETACVGGEVCEEVISGDPLGQEATDGILESHALNLRRSKRNQQISEKRIELSKKDSSKAFSESLWMNGDTKTENLWTNGDAKRCEECNNSYDSVCMQHKVQTICDKPVPSRAWATLPASYLSINKIPGTKSGETVYGVFARKTIPKRTQFGPIEGILLKAESVQVLSKTEEERVLMLLVESETGAMMKLDVSSENMSNWMRFVRVAQSFKEQNLILSQQGHSLYFTTTKVIHPRQELQVWYSLPYASKRNLPLLHPDESDKKYLEDLQNSWPCFECNEKFVNSDELQKHLNVHETERGEDVNIQKSRTRRSSRSSYRRRGLLHFSPKKFKPGLEKNEVRSYQCHTCNRIFPRNYSLKRHLLLHAKDKKFSCDVCGCHFTHIYNRDKHMRKHHKIAVLNPNSKMDFDKKPDGTDGAVPLMSGETEWFCTHCNLTFDNPSVLNLHTLAHAAENLEETETITGLPSDFMTMYHEGEYLVESGDLQCPQCTKVFPTKRELVEHVSEHGKHQEQFRRIRIGSLNPAKPWKCELCYKAFASEDRLQRHMLVHGTEESKPLQCDVCYKRFLNNSALACHVKVHTEKKIFECPICKTIFDQILSLKEHIRVHSNNGLYTCPQCSKVFDGYSLIRKHIRAFHSDRKHTCSYCGKLFPTLDKLRMHMLRHSDHREFLCANCGKQFKRKDKLKEHMKRMHSAERETRLPVKPHRMPTAKKFMPKVQVSPNDYHRFIYKCHTCLLGFKRRGMLVNHLAKRHPDISPDSVPELNLPILKTTRDYYCQYCEKVYKSSSKRKAHILKIHPGAELPMSNRRKGGVPEIPGLPNPTFSQTVGSITTHPHGCPWCHKQYASKAKLLQHQRKKHIDLLPESQQVPRVSRNISSPQQDEGKSELSPGSSGSENEPQQQTSPEEQLTPKHQPEVVQLQEMENVINIIPAEYQITATEEELRNFQESGIIIDATTLKRPLKGLPDGVSADLLTQAMSELNQSLGEFRVSVGSSPHDHFLRIVQTAPGQITVTHSPTSPDDPDDLSTPITPSESNSLPPTSVPTTNSSHLRHLLSESYSLPSSPTPSSSPRTWSNTHATYTPYTAR
ncbi:PR domain zinc finger protein 10 [Anabrus simplex]|uniref:PR domain zinc finger protein 10 n=1 Tax=Anabrus simplex TaxID=316456 RepID=UPI0035A27190